MQEEKIDISQHINLIYSCISSYGIHDEDMKSEIMTTVLERVSRTSSYDPERGSISTWLPWVVRSVISNYFRDQSASTDALDKGVLPIEAASNKIDESSDYLKDLIDLVEASDLPRQAKAICLMKERQGLTLKEVADELGMTYEACRKSYRRTLNKIQEQETIEPLIDEEWEMMKRNKL